MDIHTLGFRGEALSSIAAVSRVELITKTRENDFGITYRIEGGKEISIEETGAPDGTTFLVRQLFYNTPARRKFLKTPMTEASHVADLVTRLALSHPEISFQFINNGQSKIHTSGNGNLKDVIYHIYGRDIASHLLEVKAENEHLKLTGYIGEPIVSRGNRNFENYYINGRYVKSQMISKAIEDAYKDFTMQHKYPFTVLHLEVKGDLLDVNVHPSKLEVKFSKESELKQLIFDGVSKTLEGVNLTYQAKEEKQVFKPQLDQLDLEIDFRQEVPPLQVQPIERTMPSYIYEEKEEYQASSINQEISEQKIVEEIKETPLKEMKKKIFVKAQIHGTYIVGEDGEGMYLIDQHAAQERINYEYFLEKYSHPDMTMRDLLVPITVEYPLSECMIIEERKELLKEVGIYLDPFGNGFIIKQLPMWMNQINEHLFIEDMIQQVLKDNKIDLLSLQEHAIATLSCKASLKGNSHLSIESMQTIVDNLMRCDNPYVCPHGRPTIIHYSAYDLEKLFKRVV